MALIGPDKLLLKSTWVLLVNDKVFACDWVLFVIRRTSSIPEIYE